MAWLAEAVPHLGFLRPVSGDSPESRTGGKGLPFGRSPPPQLFRDLDIHFEQKSGAYWCYMNPTERPSFTPQLLHDLSEMQRSLKTIASDSPEAAPRYYVLASRIPGIFNLGGDLGLFAERIRAGDRTSLEHYARACIDVLYNNAISFDLPVVTMAMVQGDALGGGFEAALSCDVLIAEKGTRFGLPEVLFNLFPGMGAYSFLARKLGAARAEKIILSGRIYTAEELHEMDLVQVLAEEGAGEAAVRDYIERNSRRHNAQCAVYRTGRRVSQLLYEELSDIIQIWVDAALRLGDGDLRKMERFSSAQNRRWTPRAKAAQ